MTCLVKCAEAARAPLPPGESRFAALLSCSTCKQRFTGLVQLRLAIALWAKHARAVEANPERLIAADVYAVALRAAGESAESARLRRGILDVRTRTWGPEHCNTLDCASNLARSLIELGECAEAAVLLRTTLAAHIRTVGADNQSTLTTEGQLASVLNIMGEHAEA